MESIDRRAGGLVVPVAKANAAATAALASPPWACSSTSAASSNSWPTEPSIAAASVAAVIAAVFNSVAGLGAVDHSKVFRVCRSMLLSACLSRGPKSVTQIPLRPCAARAARIDGHTSPCPLYPTFA